MVLNLKYQDKWDSIPREDLAKAYYGFLSLSCALDVVSGVKNHIEIVQKLVDEFPNKTNKEIWYLTVISYLKIRTKTQKSYYANKLLSDMFVKYNNCNMPDNIDDIVNQINHVIPYEGLFVSLYDGVSDEDPILNTIVSVKEDIRESCEKYFIFKNVSPDFLNSTINKEHIDNEYINQFDLLFDVLIMFFIQTLEDVFMAGCYYDEMEVRSYVFEAVERFTSGIFTKNAARIANKICSELAKKELALKEEKSNV